MAPPKEKKTQDRSKELGDSQWLEAHIAGKPANPNAPTIPATEYATAYSCALTDPHLKLFREKDLELLRHVNCSYLSSGKAPTLLALKQHAQALSNLILKLTPQSTFELINGAKFQGAAQFREMEAFDWLRDLGTPYKCDDADQQLPLYAAVNLIKNETETLDGKDGIQYHCPLEPVQDFGPSAPKSDEEKTKARRWPYQTHHNLLIHANECLEILDNDYSATGGLLSILPESDKEDPEQMAGVRNTLIGQWLLYTQLLVARMHELELNLCHALDVLHGEALVPRQLLNNLGAQGRLQGQPVTYPQDRFVLANAGDDVLNQLHKQLDEAEEDASNREQAWRDQGVSGSRMWEKQRSGEETSRGLVSVEATSRFYRIQGQGNKGTIFVMPYVEGHPDLEKTRQAEVRPKVVVVPMPTWPEPGSSMQQRYAAELEEGRKAVKQNRVLLQHWAQNRSQTRQAGPEASMANAESRVPEAQADEMEVDESHSSDETDVVNVEEEMAKRT
ncbi:hypothetical protein B0I35DRAFT_424636 [Stachybotrys elegans]|uniref:Uncharacterized protein n=1 Tax=Stachybotrys elegans TaxID=80388 RepID=A0A8K0SXB6_9HYPO|nr:hypothetical protein B0I35DRAFT_424636 [Stachybotrys elegans]